MVIAHNLSLRYSRKESLILKNISATFPPGRITTLLGKSGAGKTSLLRCIAGLESPINGSIFINEIELSKMTISQRAKHVGIVFQQFHLFPHLTVLQNCMQPLMVNNSIFEDEARTKALNHLKMVEMETFAYRYPMQLSGGQQQRAAIARALCLEPQILLLDEPTSALDPVNTKTFQHLLKVFADRGLAIVISSHDTEFIRNILDRAYLIEQGSIIDIFDAKSSTVNKNCKIKSFLAPEHSS